jgi:hypothetical protein
MQPPDNIEAIAEDALQFAGNGEMQETLLRLYLKSLECDPRWSAADFQALESRLSKSQTPVIRQLLATQ